MALLFCLLIKIASGVHDSLPVILDETSMKLGGVEWIRPVTGVTSTRSLSKWTPFSSLLPAT